MQNAFVQLFIGLLVGGIIYYVSTVIPEPTLQRIVQLIGGIVIVLSVASFVLILLG